MKPVTIKKLDYDKYAYAVCWCTKYTDKGSTVIQIPIVPGKIEYKFKCDICGCEGKVYSACGCAIPGGSVPYIISSEEIRVRKETDESDKMY